MNLQPGLVYDLWMAGATVPKLSVMFDTTTDVVEAAIKQHVRRIIRRLTK